MMRSTRWLVMVVALACGGCSSRREEATEPRPPVAAVPGSHDDWCGEHGVPESQCTRCNPALAAAFKASNDWCDEHGLPESQCVACNPSLRITRPPATQGTAP